VFLLKRAGHPALFINRSLATAQGWDNLLWDKLEALQTTLQSLMDYQL